jgi:hypothetical protein
MGRFGGMFQLSIIVLMIVKCILREALLLI